MRAAQVFIDKQSHLIVGRSRTRREIGPHRAPALAQSAADSGPNSREVQVRPPEGPDTPGEFCWFERIGTVGGLVDDGGSNPPTLEKELPLVQAGARLQVLILRFGLGRHGASFRIQKHPSVRSVGLENLLANGGTSLPKLARINQRS